MMVSAPLGTLLTAMVTPFAADGSVNLDAARRLARHLVDTGSDGIVVAGTTGEGPTVSDREKLDLIDAVVSEVGGRATVVANTGSYDTHHSVALTTSALALGVDGYLVVTPYYNKPPEEGIVAHFTAIADAADGRPVIAYNIPSRVVLNLEPRVLARLAEIPNVIGVKQAMPDLDQARAILDHGGLALYAGDDNLLLPFLRMGGTGGICVVSHLAGTRLRAMIDAAHAGRLEEAQAIDDGLVPLYRALTVTTNPIPVKAGLNLLGHDAGGVRLPLVEATVEQAVVVRSALESCGIPVPAPAA
jgi:4-hydroxy-tetrahydrodipicolinate synthase